MAGKSRQDFAKGQIRTCWGARAGNDRYENGRDFRGWLTRRDENGGERVGISRRGKFEPGTKIRQKAANFDPGTDLRRTHGSGFSRESAREAKAHAAGRKWLENASGFRAGANSSQARRFAKRRRISSLARICGGHTVRDFRESRLMRRSRRFQVAFSRDISGNHGPWTSRADRSAQSRLASRNCGQTPRGPGIDRSSARES